MAGNSLFKQYRGEDSREVYCGRSGSTSSFYFSSGSSNSSSVENISTSSSSSIVNGDELTITFIPKQPSSSVCLSPLFDEILSLEEEIERLCLAEDKPVDALPRNPPMWHGNSEKSNNGGEDSFTTMKNNEFCSASSASDLPQNFAGDGLILKSLEKEASVPHLHLTNGGLDWNARFKQGVYKEIKRVVPPDSWIMLDNDIPGRSTWIFLGFKTLERNDSSLEHSWKEWTGVRHLYLELRTDVHIRRMSFYRRREPVHCLDTFSYVALIEIGTISRKSSRWLIDFVQRTRLENLQRTIAVYEEVESVVWENE